jgi:hypothetical protein
VTERVENCEGVGEGRILIAAQSGEGAHLRPGALNQEETMH